MNRYVAVVIATAIFLTVGVTMFTLNSKSPTAKINDHEFKLILAKSEKDRQIGLSKYDKTIGNDKAMLFLFEKAATYSFWMKDMKFPIDIVFIQGKRIVTIYKNAPYPKSANENLQIYTPIEDSDKVLEAKAGATSKYNIKVNDTVEFKNIE